MYSYQLILFLSSFFISILAFIILQRRNKSIKLKKFNDKGERWASQSKPIYGGTVFILTFILGFIGLAIWQPDITLDYKAYAILIVVILSFSMGMIDDLKSTNPMFKFIIQLICGIVLISANIYIEISAIAWINYLFTIFWVVGLMNSINMLDNMDAITASVSTIILISFAIFNLSGNTIFTYLSYIAVGSIVAFLFWNWSPAKIYMGDNGSQFLGIMLAIAGILGIWKYNPSQGIGGWNYISFSSIFAAYIIPISDTTTVTINRLLQKKSPFIGGRDHTTHNLFYFGLKERQIALLYISISLFTNFFAYYLLNNITFNNNVYFLILNICSATIFITLYTITKIKHKKKNYFFLLHHIHNISSKKLNK